MKQKKIPMRMCVGCREMKPKKELMRVVRGPDGTVSLDPSGKKPGRGAYVCRSGDCLSRAIRQKQLERQLEAKLADACGIDGSRGGRRRGWMRTGSGDIWA